MDRKLDIELREELNEWVNRSISLFETTPYLDDITAIYPFETIRANRLSDNLQRAIVKAYNSVDPADLIRLLRDQVTRFPYDEPLWFLIKHFGKVEENNPGQLQRIRDRLRDFTAEEIIRKLEVPPELNTQIGPMFTVWTRKHFNLLEPEAFFQSEFGIHLLDASEEDAKTFVQKTLDQELDKRPDLVAKVNKTYVIGEAKWIGQPGGNQSKQVKEVLDFCKAGRGTVRRIGIIDGFPWAITKRNGKVINNKEAVAVQESPYDILSALLLEAYLEHLQ